MLHRISPSQDFMAPPADASFLNFSGCKRYTPVPSTSKERGHLLMISPLPHPTHLLSPLLCWRQGDRILKGSGNVFTYRLPLCSLPGQPSKSVPLGRHLMILWKALLPPLHWVATSHGKLAPVDLFQSLPDPIPINPFYKLLLLGSLLSHTLRWGSSNSRFPWYPLDLEKSHASFSCQIMEICPIPLLLIFSTLSFFPNSLSRCLRRHKVQCSKSIHCISRYPTEKWDSRLNFLPAPLSPISTDHSPGETRWFILEGAPSKGGRKRHGTLSEAGDYNSVVPSRLD